MRVLTPTENKRFNELIGFIGLSLAVFLALSLLSYSPLDPSFNVSAGPIGSVPVHNWIGPVGAHLADLVFQFSGYAAFLFPVAICVVALRWFRSHTIDAPVAKLIGAGLLLTSLSAEMTLIHLPPVRGALPPGGLLGTVLAEGLRAGFNPAGANLVAVASLLTALFLTTSFSFHAAADWMKKPLAPEGTVGNWMAQFKDWREEREAARLRKRVEEIKIAGRPPVNQTNQRRVAVKDLDEDQEKGEPDPEPLLAERGPAVIKFRELEGSPAPKKSAEPKVSRGRTSYRLPPSHLLHSAERGEKMDEDELKECARAIEQKCQEFDVVRPHHADQSRPGRHHLRIQARGGHQIQPHHRPRRRSVPRAQGRIHPDRAHPRQIHGRHRSAQRAAARPSRCATDRIGRIRRIRPRS